MYSMSVKVGMDIKDGKKTLREFDVSAGGYRDEEVLGEAKTSYNAAKEMPEVKYESDDWRKERFAHLYNGMKKMSILAKKKKRKDLS